MAGARATQQPRPSSPEERECLEVIAAIEDGLADLAAGRSYTHAEVLAKMRERVPSPSK